MAEKGSDGISIILPVYNEGENIRQQVDEIEKYLLQTHEVLIVYDFTKDTTVVPAKQLSHKFPNIKPIKNIFGRGVINAVKTGVMKSSYNVCVVMPADLADDPKTINKMYAKLNRGFDIVCATRYSNGGNKVGGEFVKTTLSRLAGLTARYLLNIPTTDLTNGFKMYKKTILESIKIESTGGWEFSMEVLIKAHLAGAKVAEVPTVWKERTKGKSKFKLMKWLPKYMGWYFWGIGQRLKVNRQ